MSGQPAYTDADHFAASEAILANFNPPDGRHGSWWINPGVSATAVLDAVVPAIVARAKAEALREFANWAEQSDFDEYPFDGLDDTVKTIRARADEIEAGR